jgi:hypothetical protein
MLLSLEVSTSFLMESLFSESEVSPSSERAHRIKSFSSKSVGRFIFSPKETSSSDSDEKSLVDGEEEESLLSLMFILQFFVNVVDSSASSSSR